MKLIVKSLKGYTATSRGARVWPLAFCLMLSLALSGGASEQPLQWSRLPSIPDKEGFAGAFAGESGGALLVAGGANFPDKRPWEGGTKVWYDTVFVLEKPDGQWRPGGKLPQALGYGVALTYKDTVICVGGSGPKGHSRAVFRLHWTKGALETESLPPLPRPCANLSGALSDNTVYVAGGIEAPDSTKALNTFWSLDLARPEQGWRELPSWPGSERMLATAGTLDGVFYLFGGTALTAGPDGKPVRLWLKDAYRYSAARGWQRLADLPRVSVAAPSPAPVLAGQLLVLGGDDGAQVNALPSAHTGFPRDILAFDPAKNTWRKFGEVPFSLVTTPATQWRGAIVVPGGERMPGIRSTEVWMAKP